MLMKNRWNRVQFCPLPNKYPQLNPLHGHWGNLCVPTSGRKSISQSSCRASRHQIMVLSVKQCHAYHPPVITIFIGGINHSQNGWFLALYYPNALFLRTSPNQFVAPKLPLYQVLSNPDIRKIATKCSERPNVCFGSRGWVEQKKK
jgi:hypothetical protein